MDYGRLSIRTARGDHDDIVLSRVNNGIGSDPANQVVLNGRGIAVFHCKLVVDENGAELIDLGSNRGTLVNGTRVTLRRLSDGDKIGLGDYTIVYAAPLPAAVRSPPAAAAPAPGDDVPLPPLPRPSSSMLSSTPPESAIRLLRGSSGPIMPRTPAGDSHLRMPLPPTTQPTPHFNEPTDVSVAWAADDISEPGVPRRPRPKSGGLSVDLDRVVHLIIFEGAAPRRLAIDTREVTRIGTHMSCQCMLPYHREVFPQHAALSMDKGQWMLRKLLPTARLRVDGRDVESAELRGGEVMHVGNIRLQFKDPTQPEVSLQKRCGLGRHIALTAPTIEMGRDADLLRLSHPQVAAHQARLEQSANGWTVTNLSAWPALWVNREMQASSVLAAGDVIAVGPYHYRFRANALEPMVAPGGVCLAAVGAQAEGAEGKGLTLVVYPTELVALVHPTEASANRLLKVLCGLSPLKAGFVSFNGLRIANGMPYGMAVVRADDALPADGTVDAYLHRLASLGAAPDYPLAEVATLVDRAAASVDLSGQMGLYLADLGAADRQRVRMAAALVSQPLVLMLEDPCRDLDPIAASALVERLRELADRGTPVVFTANPGRKLLWCDQVVMLAAETQVAFTGPPHAALRYFASEAFLDAVQRLSQEKTPGSWVEAFRKAPAWQAFVEARVDAIDAMMGDLATPCYRSVPWQTLPARRFTAEFQRMWHSLLESRNWLIIAMVEAVLGGGLLAIFGPTGPTGLTSPVSAFWMLLISGVWAWGYREGLRWPTATEGQQLERVAALLGQGLLSTVLLTVQVLLVVGLLHIRLPFTPGAGGFMIVTLVWLALCGFGCGVVARRWVPHRPGALSVAMWLLAGMCIFCGSGEDRALSLAVLNPFHDALVLLASAVVGSPHTMGLLWLLPLPILALSAAATARLAEVPPLFKAGART